MPTQYAHTNIIAHNWKRLVSFYETVFGCVPVPPERDLSGDWLDKVTGIPGSHIRGIHLQLPGYEQGGPTLEIFQYSSMPERGPVYPNTPGFSHIAFVVDDVPTTAQIVFDNGGSGRYQGSACLRSAMLPTLKATLSRSRAGISLYGRNELHRSACPQCCKSYW
jgi:catechol 2,3-dioxygenase-like lactoylglutathione lyase family enzyme